VPFLTLLLAALKRTFIYCMTRICLIMPLTDREAGMVHCTKCGAELPDTAQFCQRCGQPQGVPPPNPGFRPPTPPYQPATAGLSENVAATLSYTLGWVTGIIFYLIDKRPYVRFHAAQSIVTFGGLSIIHRVVAVMFGLGWAFGGFNPFGGFGHFAGFGFGIMLLGLIGLLMFVLWIVCMIKAYQGERFMVPIAGDIAANLAGPA
jgi:uncharacterized membrane protein